MNVMNEKEQQDALCRNSIPPPRHIPSFICKIKYILDTLSQSLSIKNWFKLGHFDYYPYYYSHVNRRIRCDCITKFYKN